MPVNLSPAGGVAAQFFTDSGIPLTGGKLYTYAAGTTTPATTYTSSSGVTAHTNPIILDSAGRVPGGEIWLTNSAIYKFVLKNSADVLIATYDNVSGINDTTALIAFETTLAGSTGASLVGYLPAGVGAVTTTVQAKLRQYVSVFDYMTAAQIADVQANTLILDVTTAVKTAIAANIGRNLYFPTGSYKITSMLVFDNVGILGDSPQGGDSTQGGTQFKYYGIGVGNEFCMVLNSYRGCTWTGFTVTADASSIGTGGVCVVSFF
jgi:hypothetical protein